MATAGAAVAQAAASPLDASALQRVLELLRSGGYVCTAATLVAEAGVSGVVLLPAAAAATTAAAVARAPPLAPAAPSADAAANADAATAAPDVGALAASVVPNAAGRLDCPMCSSASFTLRNNLRRHLLSAHAAGPSRHVCGECGRAFARADDYRLHMRRHAQDTAAARAAPAAESSAAAATPAAAAVAVSAAGTPAQPPPWRPGAWPQSHPPRHAAATLACSPAHVHGPGCGHPPVHHGDHIDYIVSGVLHHQHAAVVAAREGGTAAAAAAGAGGSAGAPCAGAPSAGAPSAATSSVLLAAGAAAGHSPWGLPSGSGSSNSSAASSSGSDSAPGPAAVGGGSGGGGLAPQLFKRLRSSTHDDDDALLDAGRCRAYRRCERSCSPQQLPSTSSVAAAPAPSLSQQQQQPPQPPDYFGMSLHSPPHPHGHGHGGLHCHLHGLVADVFPDGFSLIEGLCVEGSVPAAGAAVASAAGGEPAAAGGGAASVRR